MNKLIWRNSLVVSDLIDKFPNDGIEFLMIVAG